LFTDTVEAVSKKQMKPECGLCNQADGRMCT